MKLEPMLLNGRMLVVLACIFLGQLGLLISSVTTLCRLQGKSQIVQDELVRLGEQMADSAEGTRAIALQLCREFEDKFLQHLAHGEVSNGSRIGMHILICVNNAKG